MTKINIPISRLDTKDEDFQARLDELLNREMLITDELTSAVRKILDEVKRHKDKAVIKYTNEFDGHGVSSVDELFIPEKKLLESLERIPAKQRKALEYAADRIRNYHENQKQLSWQYEEEDGSIYGQKISAIEKVGIYVPGGKANYPSSVLMLAIPAKVAGVKQIVATVPTRYGKAGDLIFAAAALAGVNCLFTIGGAQAIGALAYGTESVPKVDKITGPGNIYVTAAKKLVFGEVGIDMVAGPSELTIICDGSTNPDWIAMDLFSQAEHDEQAQSILICTDSSYLDAVQQSIDKLLPNMERIKIIETSLKNRGIFICARDLDDAARVSNAIAPEHLEISIENSEEILGAIDNAGAIFIGQYSAEALGDYCAGPSHVLPTSGTARFFSPLGVYDFQKRSSIIQCSASGANKLAKTASELARNEDFQAHALSAEYRLNKSLD
ncbi:MAG: histidinol dehydrogenase [Gammaproteobacteria bacterium]|nr:histidinol dehydrogenase [Gammaproteobacteria bacterium]